MLDRILDQLTRATRELQELAGGVDVLRRQMPAVQDAAARVQGRSLGCTALQRVAA
jgi:hypothetical protein